MNSYIGQKLVVSKSFDLSDEGEHFQIVDVSGFGTYPITAINSNNSRICLFSLQEINSYFITYEEWLSLYREEQIKSVLDD